MSNEDMLAMTKKKFIDPMQMNLVFLSSSKGQKEFKANQVTLALAHARFTEFELWFSRCMGSTK